jgi:hypothetical protein
VHRGQGEVAGLGHPAGHVADVRVEAPVLVDHHDGAALAAGFGAGQVGFHRCVVARVGHVLGDQVFVILPHGGGLGVVYFQQGQYRQGRRRAAGHAGQPLQKIFPRKGLVGVLVEQVDDALIHGVRYKTGDRRY